MNKKLCQRVHAKKRAKQRFGFEINRHQLRNLVLQIQDGKAELIEKQSERISLFKISVEDKKVIVVYDKNQHTIVSFLPENLRKKVKKMEFIIVKNAGENWEYHFETDPKIGCHDSYSAHSTYSGKCADILSRYNSKDIAEKDCKIINEMNPSGNYAVCPLVESQRELKKILENQNAN